MISKTISIDTSELFFQQNSQNGYLRYDMIVRFLAIEEYYGKNSIGFSFYYRMQKGRMGKAWADKSIDRFKRLIESYDENGYDEKSKITLDKNLNLYDGSHRMALAIYHHIPTISAKVLPSPMDVYYSLEWFYINGFSDEECQLLKEKYLKLKENLQVPFICTIWHPARKYFDEISRHLSMFGVVKEVKDYCLSKCDYQFFTRGIYAVDDIAKWKIEKKNQYMTYEDSDEYSLRVVALNVDEPNFRLKKSNNKTLSQKVESIKKLIRDAYKDQIDNYFYDIIIHIGDNYHQNKSIYRLMTMPKIDVKSTLNHMSNCQYVITKKDVPYMPSNFPFIYPLGKDIDIICKDYEEYHNAVEIILKDLKAYEKDYYIRIISFKDNSGRAYRSLIRLEQEGQFLVFQFDVASRHRTGRRTSEFVEEMVKTRIEMDNYFVPQERYEIIIRLQELHDHPKKVHHLDYVKEHLCSLDKDLCEKYLDFNWRKLVKNEIY